MKGYIDEEVLTQFLQQAQWYDRQHREGPWPDELVSSQPLLPAERKAG